MSLFYPVVLLHGGPTFYGYMHTLSHLFAPHPVIDFPQPGTKENPVSDANLNRHFDEILTQIEEYGDQPVGIVGHSWGANLACLFASHFPARVQFVIAIGTAPFSSPIEQRLQHNIESKLSIAEKQTLSDIDIKIHGAIQAGNNESLSELFGQKSQIIQKTYIVHPKSNTLIPKVSFSINGFQQSKEALWKHIEHQEIPYILNRIKSPVYAIHGQEDVIPCHHTLLFLSKHISQFSSYIIPNTGHFPWLEPQSKEKFEQIIRGILQKEL